MFFAQPTGYGEPLALCSTIVRGSAMNCTPLPSPNYRLKEDSKKEPRPVETLVGVEAAYLQREGAAHTPSKSLPL